VATVIPYFERWMQSFPTLETLARADLDQVLAHWSGLGYYARARNLHAAACLCAAEHGGELPEGAEALAALPGIGRSTANAIVSQSTDEPAAVLDGNARRVLARHAAIEGWSGHASVLRALWVEAENRLPSDRGADYTQAIMDLGATLCVRRHPSCDTCPVATDCEALHTGRVHELPSAKPRTRVSEQTLNLAIVRDARGHVLLHQRPPAGIWGGLWCLPSLDDLGQGLPTNPPLARMEHRLSHVKMNICVFRVPEPASGEVKCGHRSGWFDPADRAELGLPKPVAGLMTRLQQGEFE
jgi:A/G-specific adenine glycosylase